MKRLIVIPLLLSLFLLMSCGGDAEAETSGSVSESTRDPAVVTTAPSGEVGSTVASRAVWDAAGEDERFQNVTVTASYSGEKSGTKVYRLDGDRASVDGSTSADGASRTAVMERIRTMVAVLSFYDQFTYDTASGCYRSTDDIEYGVSVDGVNATITVTSATVRFSGARVTEISCKMHQSAAVNGEAFECDVDVTFLFTDYGTTVVGC